MKVLKREEKKEIYLEVVLSDKEMCEIYTSFHSQSLYIYENIKCYIDEVSPTISTEFGNTDEKIYLLHLIEAQFTPPNQRMNADNGERHQK